MLSFIILIVLCFQLCRLCIDCIPFFSSLSPLDFLSLTLSVYINPPVDAKHLHTAYFSFLIHLSLSSFFFNCHRKKAEDPLRFHPLFFSLLNSRLSKRWRCRNPHQSVVIVLIAELSSSTKTTTTCFFIIIINGVSFLQKIVIIILIIIMLMMI